MLVIFGTKVVGKTISTGTFQCARCNCERTYVLKQNKKFFSLFFIPFIPLNNVGDTLECTFCKTAYIPNANFLGAAYTSSTAEIDTLSRPLAAVGKRLGAY
ncbi:MAG: zinc-ribbon domain-containing protein, partial [Pedobacter sp.]